MSLTLQLIVFFLLVSFGVVVYMFYKASKKKKLRSSLHQRLLLLRFPKHKKEGGSVLEEIAKSEHLFTSLSSFQEPFVIEVAVPYIGEEINIYVSVPDKIINTFIKQIYSIWSDVHIEEAGEYTPFSPKGYSSIAYVQQKDDMSLPLNTYKDLESDTFQSIIGGLSKVKELGEGGAVQFIVKPASSAHKKNIKSKISSLKKGKDIQKGAASETRDILSKALLPTKDKNDNQDNEPKSVDQNLINLFEKKISKPLFKVNVRVVASADTESGSESILEGITAGFSRLSNPEGNELKITKTKKSKDAASDFSFRRFSNKHEMVLNSEELVSIFHFPTPFTDVPRLKSLKSRQLPPSVDLPKSGVLLGNSIYRGEQQKVFLGDEDRRRHFYVIGQTGTGKSNLMISVAQQDIARGKGVAIIDPHGDLVEHILGSIPSNRMKDVILFDPSSLDNPIGLNMLEFNQNKPEEKTFIVNEMIAIFDSLYDLKSTGGPMFEQYMRNALLLLMEDMPNEPATLMEVPRIFSDSDYRKRKLARIMNPTVIDFWEKEAEKAGGEAALQNITPYITSKFNTFTANDYMRIIIGQEKSSFSFREIMDNNKILLVNLSKGKIGEINANLLGMIIVGKLLMASLGRVDIPQEERKDFYLFIDEFQNFTTESIATILSEARKYRLNLTVAHQFIAQLKESIRDAVFGNVGSLASFRVGSSDADFLVKNFEPFLTTEDLVNISNYHAYVKLLVKGESSDPFQIKALKAEDPNQDIVNKIKDMSRLEYGRNREEVERSIYNRLRN